MFKGLNSRDRLGIALGASLVCIGVFVLVAGLAKRPSPDDPFMAAFSDIRIGTPRSQVLSTLPQPARASMAFDLPHQSGYEHYDREARAVKAQEWLVWTSARPPGHQRSCALALGPDSIVVYKTCRTYRH